MDAPIPHVFRVQILTYDYLSIQSTDMSTNKCFYLENVFDQRSLVFMLTLQTGPGQQVFFKSAGGEWSDCLDVFYF